MTGPHDKAPGALEWAQHQTTMRNALERGQQLHQAVDADLRWNRQKLMAAEANPLGRIQWGRRDADLARMVVKNIRQTMPPILMAWHPRLQQILHDHHLQPVPLALQEDNITPAAHRHDHPQPAGMQIWRIE
jgi:hypothetical protein